jgi:hypothetical protein
MNGHLKKVTIPRFHKYECPQDPEPRAPKLPPPPRVTRPGDVCGFCSGRHTSWGDAVVCAYGKVHRIDGRPAPNGPCVVIECRCRDRVTMALVDNMADAQGKLADVVRACAAFGKGCQGKHRIIALA